MALTLTLTLTLALTLTLTLTRFDVWLEALVWTFHGCRMRIGLGAYP